MIRLALSKGAAHSPADGNPDQDNVYALKVRIAFFVVVLLSFFCFIPDLNNELLIWDDSGYITDNPYIRSFSPETFGWAFTTFYCNYWAPLTWLSFAADYAWWGLNPLGYHLTNNVIHALNAGMFFLLSLKLLHIYRMGRNPGAAKKVILNTESALYCSLIAALFFALHPLRVESVAWAAERKDVLSFFFGIPAVLAYLRYTQSVASPSDSPANTFIFLVSPYYWLAVALYCLSLLSKSMLVTLPVVLLVLDWFPLKRFGSRHMKQRIFMEKLPLLALAGFCAVITIISQGSSHISLEQSDMMSRMLNAVKSIMAYLWLTFWHTDLSPFYLHPGNIATIGLEYGLPLFFFGMVTLFCLIVARRWPFFMAFWLIYLITLSPVLGLAAVGPTAMGARFTYIPGLPVSLLVALGITTVWTKYSHLRQAVIAMGLATLLLLLINSAYTLRQISFWKDDVSLWSRVIELRPHSTGRAYFQRSYAYAVKGEYQKALADINEALAIAESKNYNRMHDLWSVRAGIFRDMNDLDRAIADLGRAIQTAHLPDRSQYVMERGLLYQMQGKSELADADFRSASEGAADK